MWLSTPKEEGSALGTMRVVSYCSIVLAALGFIGNCFTIRLTLNHEIKKISCCVFLFTLAITDSIVLIYEVMDDIALHIPHLGVYDILFGYNEWRCRFGVFFYQTARTMSAWLVVALATELCMAASIPDKRPLVYNRNRALYVTVAVLLVATAAGFPFLVLAKNLEGSEDEDSNPNGRCSSMYEVFYLVYSTMVMKGAAQCVVPIIIIIICGIISMVSLRKYKNIGKYRAASISGNQHLNRSGVPLDVTPCQAEKVIGTVSVVYILSILPTTIIEVMVMSQVFVQDVPITWPWYLAINVTNVTFLINYACKFIVILLVGAEFRSAFGGKRHVDLDRFSVGRNNRKSKDLTNGHTIANGLIRNGSIFYPKGTSDPRF